MCSAAHDPSSSAQPSQALTLEQDQEQVSDEHDIVENASEVIDALTQHIYKDPYTPAQDLEEVFKQVFDACTRDLQLNVSADNVQLDLSANNVQLDLSVNNVQLDLSANNVQLDLSADNVHLDISANNVQLDLSAKCVDSILQDITAQDIDDIFMQELDTIDSLLREAQQQAPPPQQQVPPPRLVKEFCRGKTLTCLVLEPDDQKYALLETIHLVFFHSFELWQFVFAVETMCNISVVHLTREEEIAFIVAYDLPTTHLRVSKALCLDDFQLNFDLVTSALVIMFREAGEGMIDLSLLDSILGEQSTGEGSEREGGVDDDMCEISECLDGAPGEMSSFEGRRCSGQENRVSKTNIGSEGRGRKRKKSRSSLSVKRMSSRAVQSRVAPRVQSSMHSCVVSHAQSSVHSRKGSSVLSTVHSHVQSSAYSCVQPSAHSPRASSTPSRKSPHVQCECMVMNNRSIPFLERNKKTVTSLEILRHHFFNLCASDVFLEKVIELDIQVFTLDDAEMCAFMGYYPRAGPHELRSRGVDIKEFREKSFPRLKVLLADEQVKRGLPLAVKFTSNYSKNRGRGGGENSSMKDLPNPASVCSSENLMKDSNNPASVCSSENLMKDSCNLASTCSSENSVKDSRNPASGCSSYRLLCKDSMCRDDLYTVNVVGARGAVTNPWSNVREQGGGGGGGGRQGKTDKKISLYLTRKRCYVCEDQINKM